jgi:hypothetical protein
VEKNGNFFQYVIILESVDKKDLRLSSFKHFCFGDDVQHDLTIDARELGGAIAPLWPLYLKKDTKKQVRLGSSFGLTGERDS